jgi:alkylation response protein AidB-like acyl-CoA dehydrogenase
VDLELTPDQQELRETARRALASACPPSLVRDVFEGRGDAGELWSRLVALDWPGLGIDRVHGGLGLGPVEVGVLVEELGRVVAPSPFVATVTQLVPLLQEAPGVPAAGSLLERVAAGTATGTVAVAEGGDWRLEAVATTATPTGTGWTLDGVKSHVLDGVGAHESAVVARAPDGQLGAFLVPAGAPGLRAEGLAVMDPTMPLATVTLAGVEVPAERVLLGPRDPRTPAALARALDAATAALALSTVATCRAIFDTTLQYAKDREQFGRPIGSFQAVKHRLADCYLAVERATALAWFAVLTVAEDDARRPVAVAMAKAAAGACQRRVVADGLQLHGGIGFTWEHDLHLLLKRAKTGDFLFGTAAAHRARLARLLGLEAA